MTVYSIPIEKSWPEGGIEIVSACPVCQSHDRSLLHKGLSDEVFFVAPGSWDLWRCGECLSAWLDPRPNEATIGIAYGRYYTHFEIAQAPPSGLIQSVRFALGNGYRNRRYGTNSTPASSLGPLVSRLLPPLRWRADMSYRFLPRSIVGIRNRVLDIGCGTGTWLTMAQNAGWEVAGVEPDPISSTKAMGRGIEIRPNTIDWLDEAGKFDFITLSHVIEHVHDPIGLLKNCATLLRSGGSIFIDTPNIDAVGHQIYGRHWRGLETPRHLVLFNRQSLSQSVFANGFKRVRFPDRFYPFAGMCLQSRKMAAGVDPYSNEIDDSLKELPDLKSRITAALVQRRSEFITLMAERI